MHPLDWLQQTQRLRPAAAGQPAIAGDGARGRARGSSSGAVAMQVSGAPRPRGIGSTSHSCCSSTAAVGRSRASLRRRPSQRPQAPGGRQERPPGAPTKATQAAGVSHLSSGMLLRAAAWAQPVRPGSNSGMARPRSHQRAAGRSARHSSPALAARRSRLPLTLPAPAGRAPGARAGRAPLEAEQQEVAPGLRQLLRQRRRALGGRDVEERGDLRARARSLGCGRGQRRRSGAVRGPNTAHGSHRHGTRQPQGRQLECMQAMTRPDGLSRRKRGASSAGQAA